MKDKLKKDKATSETIETTEKDNEEIVQDLSIDVASLSEEEAKRMIEELLEENKAVIKERDELQKELEGAKDESAKFKDNWYHVAAEFENFKKRNEFARRNAYDDGLKDAILPMLNIGDSIDRALAVELDDKTREGVMLVRRQFSESLAALKVAEIDPKGEIFDPMKSEAIATLPTENDEDDNKVVQVYKKGYEVNGKILRYAQVVVHKKS